MRRQRHAFRSLLLAASLAPAQDRRAGLTEAEKKAKAAAKPAKQPKQAKQLTVSTFHSLGVQILRREAKHLGLKERFSIMDSDDVLGILRDAGGTTDAKVARTWQWTISLWKNQGLNAETALAQARDDNERVIAKIRKIARVAFGAAQKRDAITQLILRFCPWQARDA